ncbi:MAG: transposase [Anaerovoracaceae bacterium]|nr:transposase [Anaerovoracaceae bacterium]
MNDYPNFVKKTLCSVVDAMELQKEKFVKTPGKDFTRHLIFDFSTIIIFVLSAGCNTQASELMNFFDFKQFPSVPAFVQQRDKILPDAFHHILIEFNNRMNVSPKLFHGYRLLAVDGSDLTLPFNPKEPENIRTKDHCNFLHMNTIYDVCSKLYVDASLYAGTKCGEVAAAVEFVKHLPEKFPVILIVDRGYESYNLFAHVEERLFDYVIRIKDAHSFDFIENSKDLDYEIQIRFVRFKLDNGEYEVLATSLPEEIFSVDALKEIYHMRWNIETSYLLSKWVLGMTSYHSKKAANVKQEVYADLRTEERGKKHTQQINFTQAIKICLHFFRASEDTQAFNLEATIRKFLHLSGAADPTKEKP